MNNESSKDQLAHRICDVLDQGTATLDEKAIARLREIRHAALERQAHSAPVFSLAGIGHGIEQAGHFFGDSLHNHYRGILAAIALLVGALGADLWQNAQQATELAEIDSALLSDEVPPGAYTDQGFLEWLEHLTSDEQQDNSLPE
jgi:hypothetical protein